MRLLSLVLLLLPGLVVAMELQVVVTTNDGTPLADAAVVAVAGNPAPVTLTTDKAVVDQLDKAFVPGLLVVQAGTRVVFPNRDQIRHQVYSFSPAKRFELPLYAGVDAPPIVFDTPGPVALGCNIHDWMRGYIYVADSPWFAKTDGAGHANLELPAGEYTVRIWHPRMVESEDSTRQSLTATDATVSPMRWQISLKPQFAPRRAPIGESGGTY